MNGMLLNFAMSFLKIYLHLSVLKYHKLKAMAICKCEKQNFGITWFLSYIILYMTVK